MNEYDNLTILELRELLWEREIVPARWMLTYIRKAEAIRLLIANRPIPENSSAAEKLKKRQKEHVGKAMKAQKDRAIKFGTSKLTPEERLKRVVDDNKPLTFVTVRDYDEPFESATGSRRGKSALVFVNSDGEEVLLTRGEATTARSFGLNVPFHVLQPPRKAQTAKKKPPKSFDSYFS